MNLTDNIFENISNKLYGCDDSYISHTSYSSSTSGAPLPKRKETELKIYVDQFDDENTDNDQNKD